MTFDRPALAARLSFPLALALVLSACGGGAAEPGTASVSITGALQDLDLDPSGVGLVVSFSSAPPALIAPGNFDSDGAQTAVAVDVDGMDVTVDWDAPITVADQVRVIGLANFSTAFVPVTTTDDDAPTFVITSATQTLAVGGDGIVADFSGARLMLGEAEDPAAWELTMGGEQVDLTGSTFDLDVPTQVLTIALGSGASLHADFELAAVDVHSVAGIALASVPVAGVATGDADAPALIAAAQNLAEDEFGRTVDFVFDEPMDPLFNDGLGAFDAGFPVFATSIALVGNDTLRVSFTAPLIPGLATVDFDDVVDAHGNPVSGSTLVSAGSTVVNAVDQGGVVPVENQGGDYLEVTYLQALEPSSAADDANWSLVIDGDPVDLGASTFDYQLLDKRLVIDLPGDYHNGDAFSLTPVGTIYEVDGETLSAVLSGSVAGETQAPTISAATQNRDVDPDGLTYDVEFSEQLDPLEAEDAANWSVTGGASVLSASLQPSLLTVRLALDAVAVPGVHTLDLDAVEDLAGNAIAPVSGMAIDATDAVAPTVTSASAEAVEGEWNDVLRVTFDDHMHAAPVEDLANWSLESPVGAPVDLSLATLSYDEATKTAVLSLGGANDVNLQAHDDFAVSLANAHDVSGNPLAAGPYSGPVAAEQNYPRLVSAFVPSGVPNEVHVRFSEPCAWLDDLAGGTLYDVSDGVIGGSPGAAIVDADRMGAALVFGFAIPPGSTLAVTGVTDLAGNPHFAVEAFPVASEDPFEPAVDGGLTAALTVTGEENDALTVVFDRDVSAWQVLDPARYAVSDGGPALDLALATFSFDGASTVSIDLDGAGADDLATGGAYTVTVDGLLSAQGVAMSASSSAPFAPAGDVTPPAVVAGRVTLDPTSSADTILIEMDEAVRPADAEDELNFAIGGTNPDLAVRLGPRTVRAVFSGGVAVGQTLDLTLVDLAQNAGIASEVIAAADGTGPLIVSVTASAVANAGGDRIEISFSEPVDPVSALNPANYTLSGGGGASLAGASLRYQSGSSRVVLELAPGQELAAGAAVTVGVSAVSDHSGNAMVVAASIHATVGGDATGPSLADGFVNYREDASGLVVDLRFDEAVDAALAESAGSYAVAGTSALAAELLRDDVVRLTLAGPMTPGGLVTAVSLADLAGNVTAASAFAPVD